MYYTYSEMSIFGVAMVFDKELLDGLTHKAMESERLRMNMDLRDSADADSQRMLNALEPGTMVPIHRHRGSSEALVVLRGSCLQHIYDEQGRLTESIRLEAGSSCAGMVIDRGVWHRLESLESGTVIMECKEDKWAPLSKEDIWE